MEKVKLAMFGQHVLMCLQFGSKGTIWIMELVTLLCQVGQGILAARCYLKMWRIGLDVKAFVFGLL